MNETACYLCRKDSRSSLLGLSCGHSLCKACLSHTLILTEFKSITNEEVTFKCYCDKGGALSVDLKTVVECFEIDRPPMKCLKHQQTSEHFCLDCKIWLCGECKKAFHTDYLSFHRLSNSEPNRANKCLKHNKMIEMYCSSCERELCSACTIEDNAHSADQVEISSIHSAFKDDLMRQLNYKSYDNIERMLNGKEALYQKELMNSFIQAKSKVENVITAFKLLLDSLNAQVKAECVYSTGLFHLMRFAYYNLYQSIHNASLPVAVTRELKKIRRDIGDIDILPEDTKDIDDIVNSLWKIKQKTLMKCTIRYSEQSEKEGQQDQKLIEVLDSGHIEFMSAFCALNEEIIATGSVDHSVRLFKLTNNSNSPIEYLGGLNEHRGAVRAICLLNDGRLATGSNDKTVKLWDLSTMSCSNTLSGHLKCVRTVIQLKNNCIASGGNDMKIIIWDLSTVSPIRTLTGHTQPIFKLCLLEGNTLSSCSEDKTIKLWSNDKCVKTLNEHTKGVTCLNQLRDERLLSGSKDGSIKVWDLKSYNCVQSIKAHLNWVNVIREIKNGLVATGGRDNVIKIWELQSSKCLKTITGHTNTILDMLVVNERKIISGSCDKTFMIINNF